MALPVFRVCADCETLFFLENFTTYTRAKTLDYPSDDLSIIKKTAKKLAEEFDGKRIRLIGVRVSNMESSDYQRKITDFMRQAQGFE